MAVQLIATAGGNLIGVISDDDKRDFVMGLGARGVINRKSFNCWGQMPKVGSPEYRLAQGGTRVRQGDLDLHRQGQQCRHGFRAPRRDHLSGVEPRRETRRHGGDLRRHHRLQSTVDARYLWMHQKRLQGSHFANLMQASNANKLVIAQRIDPCMSEVYSWRDIPKAHMKMWKNEHRPGNMAVLVSALRTGLRTFDDVIEAVAS